MIRLGISPSYIAQRAFREEVRLREEKEELRRVQEVDPRLTVSDLRRRTTKIRRLLRE